MFSCLQKWIISKPHSEDLSRISKEEKHAINRIGPVHFAQAPGPYYYDYCFLYLIRNFIVMGINRCYSFSVKKII